MKTRTTHLLAAMLLVCGVLSSAVATAQSNILEELDRTIEATDNFVNARRAKIDHFETMLQQEALTTQQRHNIYNNLFWEFRSFQLDKAMEMLDHRHAMSVELGDKSLMADDMLDRALLYTISGMFFEASEVLDKEIDTLSLTHKQLVAYYNTQQRFHSDFWHYTGDEETRNRSGAKKAYYRKRILAITSATDPLHRDIVVRELGESGRWAEAEALNLELLSDYSPDDHEYAMYAYDRARILEALGRRGDMREWFARSAMADIRTATKDNAALCSLAQSLLECDDIDRAFRYVTISLNDALFYNAKLRPWQISAVIPDIEKAYQSKQQAYNETLR